MSDKEIYAMDFDGTANEAMRRFADIAGSSVAISTLEPGGPLTDCRRFRITGDPIAYRLCWVWRTPHYRFYIMEEKR